MKKFWLITLGTLLLPAALLGVSHAANSITIDGTLRSPVMLTGPNYDLNNSLGAIRGSNLFFSFGRFGLLQGETATFSSTVGGISNILGRVTGGQLSFIDGLLKSTIPGANLYLLNPAGVIFGSHASLDLGGSFHVSTADYVKFNTGEKFFVDPANTNTVLSVAPVTAFGFLSPNTFGSLTPAAITVQESFLKVPDGQTLSVVGGDINITGGTFGALKAQGGRVNIASVKSQGEVSLADLNVDGFSSRGEIRLTDNAQLNVSGDSAGVRPAGTVVIRGGRLVVQDSSVFSINFSNANAAPVGIDIRVTGDFTVSNGDVSTISVGAGRGGDLHVAAGNVEMSGGLIGAVTVGAGRAGDVFVNVGDMTLAGEGQISSSTFGAGAAGNITVRATGAVGISGQNSAGNSSGIFSSAELGSSGDAGLVALSAKSLTITGGGTISTNTLGTGHAGSVAVAVAGPLTISGAGPLDVSSITSDTSGSGNAGPVSVSASTLTLTGGGAISSSTGLGSSGQGGSVTVTAGDSLLISGQAPDGSPSIIAGETGGGGDAGPVSVSSRTLTLTGGGTISSATFGTGRGGNIIVSASDLVSISDPASGIFSTSEAGATGRGGDIQLNAGNVTLNNSAVISAKSAGTGDAGNIFIQAGDRFLMSNSSVTTNAPLSSGGNISIYSQFIIVDPSQIIASALINGGNITMVATKGSFFSLDSIIDASGTLGISGTISIQSPTTSLSGTLAPLSQAYMQAAALLSARCAARLSGKSSSFVLAGRDGLPPEPGGFLPSPLAKMASGARAARGLGTNSPELRVSPGLASSRSSTTRQPLDMACR